MQAQPETYSWEPPSKWIDHPNAYRVHLLIIAEKEGGYSAIALNLPGAGSSGETVEEAIENAEEAIRGVLESYEADGEQIPWRDSTSEQIPADAIEQWITVDV